MAENKDTTIADGASRWAQFFTEKADKIKYFVIALVIIVVAAVAIVSGQRRAAQSRSAEASNSVFQSMIDIQNKSESEIAEIFKKAADQYGDLPVGAQARMVQFSAQFKEGDFAGAEQAARDFIKTYPQNPLAPRAQVALGQSLAMQGKLSEAIDAFRKIIASGNAGVLPEAKLALAQAIEASAEAVKDNPVEYRALLEEAMAEYTDILSRAQNPAISQRGYWPQTVVLPADYSLTIIKDKLAGQRLDSPRPLRPPTADASEDLQAVLDATVPAAGDEAETSEAEPEAGDGEAAQESGE